MEWYSELWISHHVHKDRYFEIKPHNKKTNKNIAAVKFDMCTWSAALTSMQVATGIIVIY